MCLFKTPKIKQPEQVKKEEVTSQEDAVATELARNNRKKGFQFSNPTGGMGVTDTANIKKTQLGT